MYALFKSLSVYKILTLLVAVLSALALALFIKIFLPQEGVDFEPKSDFTPRYVYRLSALFFENRSQKLEGNTQEQGTQSQNYADLQGWKLQALYKEGSRGFVVLSVSGATHYLNLQEQLQGYLLTKILAKEAIFEKDAREYRLSLVTQEERQAAQMVQNSDFVPDINRLSQGIVKRQEINYHMQHPDKIWSQIKIVPYKRGTKEAGYIIRFVNKNSVFDHLGLQTGDILISANGTRLDSLEKAKQLYSDIDKISALAVTVRRRGKLKELLYEIK